MTKTTTTGELTVTTDINCTAWATYRRQPNGDLKRFQNPKLPARATQTEAEHDLLEWVSQKCNLTASGAERERLQPLYDRLLKKLHGRGLDL